MVGLDVCHQTHLYPEQVQTCAKKGTALGQFVAEATAPWFKIMAGGVGSSSLHLYDSLAVAAAAAGSLVSRRVREAVPVRGAGDAGVVRLVDYLPASCITHRVHWAGGANHHGDADVVEY